MYENNAFNADRTISTPDDSFYTPQSMTFIEEIANILPPVSADPEAFDDPYFLGKAHIMIARYLTGIYCITSCRRFVAFINTILKNPYRLCHGFYKPQGRRAEGNYGKYYLLKFPNNFIHNLFTYFKKNICFRLK